MSLDTLTSISEAGINLIAAWSLPALAALAVAYLLRLDRDPANPFKLWQFVCGPDDKANTASLAYVAALAVSTWLLWFEALNGRLQEWLFAAYVTAFVLGGVARAKIGSAERMAAKGEDT